LRPGAGARLAPGPRIGEWRTGLAFLFAALAVAGLPPLSGFVAKLGVLRASLEAAGAAAAWIALLASTLVAVIALARAGSILFWRPAATRIGPIESPSTVAMSAPPGRRGAIGLLAACIALLTVAAEPVSHFTEAAARQTLDVDAYVAAVIRPPEDERSPGIVIDADRLRTHQPGATVDPRGMSL
jgi:multicomponent K+:H+ antiporter subunit D